MRRGLERLIRIGTLLQDGAYVLGAQRASFFEAGPDGSVWTGKCLQEVAAHGFPLRIDQSPYVLDAPYLDIIKQLQDSPERWLSVSPADLPEKSVLRDILDSDGIQHSLYVLQYNTGDLVGFVALDFKDVPEDTAEFRRDVREFVKHVMDRRE